MDEHFDINEIELNDIPQVPPVNPQPQEPPAEAVLSPVAPVKKRRKKRRKRPTWQRFLWKYWPPIRFGLIILATVLMIWLLFSSIAAIFGGTKDPVPTDPPQPSQSTEPTGTEPPTEAPTAPPTEPPTTAPTAPPDPYAGAVSDAWYENTLFIGDFNIGGLGDVARAGNADYFSSSNMGVFNWDEEKSNDDNFDTQNLPTLLSTKMYDKIIINLGINNCGYPTSSLIGGYSGLVDAVRQAQPDAKIILHGILPVTETYADGVDYFSASHIAEVNDRIAQLADGETVFYIQISDEIISASGHLLSSCSIDGYHLTAEAYKNWAKLIGVQLGKLEID